MLTLKLEKTVSLYRNQFEERIAEIHGCHRLERLSIELDHILFKVKYMYDKQKDLDKLPEMKDEFVQYALELRQTFGSFLIDLLDRNIGYDNEKFTPNDLVDVLAQSVNIDAINVTFDIIIISSNREYLEYIDEMIPDDEVYNLDPNKFFRFYTDSYNDGISKAYPELFEVKSQDKIGTGKDADIFCHTFTFQTTEDCSLHCTYCYQFNKSNMRMEFETAKKFIDELLNDKYGYINQYNSPAIILEFIGGEPLLEIILTRKIYEYFLDQCYELNHPWFKLHRVSICSNGLQYFDDEVQDFFKKYAGNVSFNISIDGNKELHDSCRIQPNGEGSYDVDMMALKHYTSNYAMEKNSKMTLAPENISHLFESVVHFINSGMQVINLNCIFEEGWNQRTALIEYEQLKLLANHILDNDLEHLYIAIFNERQEEKQDPVDDGNFCFSGYMSIAGPNGSKQIKDVKIGDLLYTASGSIHQVSRMYHGKDSITTVKLDGLADVRCTKYHKFYSSNTTGEYDFRPINELSVGDFIWNPLLKFPKESKYKWIHAIAYSMGIYIAMDGDINTVDSDRDDSFFINAFNEDELPFTFSQCTADPDTVDFTIINDGTLPKKFFKYVNDCEVYGGLYRIPRQIFEADVESVRLFINGYIDTLIKSHELNSDEMNIEILDSDIRHDIILLGRSSGLNIRQSSHNINELIYTPSLNIDDLNSIPDGYWVPILNKSHDNKMVDVYCPTVMPLTNDAKEEHSIILGSLGALNCGGSGSMLSLRPNGEFYPCIRYMPTSIDDSRMNLCMGTINDGMIERGDDSEVLKLLDSVTRRAQMNDICYDCPIGTGCAGCSALSHTVYGTPNKKTTFACIQMIAEALANVYYWNLLNLKHPEYNLGPRYNNVPEEWALLVIDKEELDYLYTIEARSVLQHMESKGIDFNISITE